MWEGKIHIYGISKILNNYHIYIYMYIYMRWVQVILNVNSQELHLLWTMDYY